MSISIEELDHITKLSCIYLSIEEKEKFVNQFNDILNFVSQLDELDVEGVQPLSHPLEGKYLNLREGAVEFEDPQLLLNNVEHKIINNGIVVKSPIKS